MKEVHKRRRERNVEAPGVDDGSEHLGCYGLYPTHDTGGGVHAGAESVTGSLLHIHDVTGEEVAKRRALRALQGSLTELVT